LGDDRTHLVLAYLHARCLQYEAAEADIQAAMRSDVGAPGHFMLAALRWRQLRTKEARAELQAARSLENSRAANSAPVMEAQREALLTDPILLHLETMLEKCEKLDESASAPAIELPPAETEVWLACLDAIHLRSFERVCRIEALPDEWVVHRPRSRRIPGQADRTLQRNPLRADRQGGTRRGFFDRSSTPSIRHAGAP
jgi:hypothetical protein